MSTTPTVTPAESLSSFATRVGGYLAILLMVLATTPVPTAAMLGWLLAMVDCPVTVQGSLVQIGGTAQHLVTSWWSATPVVVLGASLILAHRATLGQQLGGVALVTFNSLLVNLLVMGLLLQAPPVAAHRLVRSLQLGYPVVMGGLLVVTVLYWTRRVVLPAQKAQVG